MIKIEKQLPGFDDYGKLLGYTPKTSLFLDIETTGLSPSSTTLYMIGTITMDDDCQTWRLTQWMAENREEESLLLAEFLRFLESYDTLIHFNGTTFDLPYLTAKLEQFKMENTLSKKKSLDLYRIFRPFKTIFGLTHMNQETLQAFLGQQRADPLNGKALIPVWRKYAKKPDPALADTLLLHNQEDLCGMTSLLCLCAYSALFDGKVSPKSCRLHDNSLVVVLHLEYPLPQNIQISLPVSHKTNPTRRNTLTEDSADWSSQISPAADAPDQDPQSDSAADSLKQHPQAGQYVLTTDFTNTTLEIPAFQGELLYFFLNYRDYYYLPLERQAVHRSVAAFVDREHRVPAKRSNCFTRKNSIFLPQPSRIVTPLFVPYYRSRDLYFEYTENYELHPELLSDYIKAILKSFL